LSLAGVALGSNLGNRRELLDAAVVRLAALGEVVVCSSWIETEPEGGVDQPRYLNGVLLLETALAPLPLLHGLLEVEQGLGRARPYQRAPRTMDLDLLFYDDQVVHSVELQLPHPRMTRRRFVLEPLAVIAPTWRHPTLDLTAHELLEGFVPSTSGLDS
jgi:2-amino-4-hydroxy-6-hydroxymethyldihydropteridine diphosphokinase